MSITVKLDSELEARVRAQIDETTSLSDFVRSALIEKLERCADRTTPAQSWRKHLQAAQQVPLDREDGVTSENLSEKMRERVRAKHRAG